jgi:hypothetical protein
LNAARKEKPCRAATGEAHRAIVLYCARR